MRRGNVVLRGRDFEEDFLVCDVPARGAAASSRVRPGRPGLKSRPHIPLPVGALREPPLRCRAGTRVRIRATIQRRTSVPARHRPGRCLAEEQAFKALDDGPSRLRAQVRLLARGARACRAASIRPSRRALPPPRSGRSTSPVSRCPRASHRPAAWRTPRRSPAISGSATGSSRSTRVFQSYLEALGPVFAGLAPGRDRGEHPGARARRRADGAVEQVRRAAADDRQQVRDCRRLLHALRRHGGRAGGDQRRAEDVRLSARRVHQRTRRRSR